MIGHILGNYRLVAEIGKGGMAQVFLAEHVAIGSQAAVKVLLPAFSRNPAMLERFFQEAQVTASVRHNGIVEIFDYGLLEDGRAYLVMEYLQGETLHNRMRREKRLPLDQALNVIRQIAHALAAAHRVNIVHRDLKPDNIYLVPDEEVWGGERAKILDFGIAKVNMAGFGDRSMTKTGVIIGTPDYMPPEQCKGLRNIDHRADLYSLGCILFKLLTGRTPFADHATGEVISCHVLKAPPRPDSLVTGIPPNVTALIMKLLEKEPDDRFASADELLSVLERMGSPSSHGMQLNPLAHMSGMNEVPHTAITQAGHVAALRARTASAVSAVGQHSTLLAPEPQQRDTGRTPISTLSSAANYHTVALAGDPPPQQRSMGRYFVAVTLALAMVGAAAFSASELFGDTPLDDASATTIDSPRQPTPVAASQPSATATSGTTAEPPVAPTVPEVEPDIEIEIRTIPGGAKVYLMPDRALLGKTPGTFKRTRQQGKYEFLLKLDGHEEFTLVADADRSETYSQSLERLEVVATKVEKTERKTSRKRTRKIKRRPASKPNAKVKKASEDTGLLGLE